MFNKVTWVSPSPIRLVYSREEEDIRNMCTQRKGHVRIQGEGSSLRAKEGDLQGTNTADTSASGFQPPEL